MVGAVGLVSFLFGLLSGKIEKTSQLRDVFSETKLSKTG